MHTLKGRVITGPTLRNIQSLGLDGQTVDIATAFYTRRALESLTITARKVRLLCRIDLARIDEWCSGYVAPDALLDKMKALREMGAEVSLFGHHEAHVKAYTGSKGALVGSANLTLRGFGGGLEMVVHTISRSGVDLVRASLSQYQQRLTKISIEDLAQYVRKNLKTVQDAQKKARTNVENKLPDVPRDRILNGFGSYQSFLVWLKKRPGEGARVILARANGQGNLQGHIHRNFYGLRQYFLTYPEFQVPFSKQDATTYKLSKDVETEALIKEFVESHATDEDDFKLEIWKTYLPQECGGRAEKHGGTIGNLNRMLPLVAQYLEFTSSRPTGA